MPSPELMLWNAITESFQPIVLPKIDLLWWIRR